MDKVFVAIIGVVLVILARMALLSADSVLGSMIPGGAVISFFGFCFWLMDRLPRGPESQEETSQNPGDLYQGWDPKVIQAARRRADGID